MRQKPVFFMKYAKLSIFILLTMIRACLLDINGDDEDTGFIYPLQTGNVWKYERRLSFYFYTDTTDSKQYLDSLLYSSEITNAVTGRTILRDTVETIEMIGTEQDGPHTFTSVQYYQNRTDGLYLLAYHSAGNMILPKTTAKKRIRFKDTYFDNYNQILDYIQACIPIGKVVSDSLYFEDPPVKVLSYPLRIGEQWTYRNTTQGPFHIDRKIEGKETLRINNTSYDCYKIRSLYDLDHDGQWDEDIRLTDFISQEGLLQRTITILGLTEISTQLEETGRLIDTYEHYILTDLTIQ